MERTVMVWGKPEKVTVYKKSKSVWIATGTYMGEHLETKGSSEASAAAHWVAAARYRGG